MVKVIGDLLTITQAAARLKNCSLKHWRAR
jgi:hypothetical protein